jgi:hypothetical protein
MPTRADFAPIAASATISSAGVTKTLSLSSTNDM